MSKKIKVLFAGGGGFIMFGGYLSFSGIHRKGRSVASAGDCAHHGATPSFLNWEYTNKYLGNIVKWCAKLL